MRLSPLKLRTYLMETYASSSVSLMALYSAMKDNEGGKLLVNKMYKLGIKCNHQ